MMKRLDQHLGWRHAMVLRDGIEDTYRWFVKHEHEARRRPPPAREMRRTDDRWIHQQD